MDVQVAGVTGIYSTLIGLVVSKSEGPAGRAPGADLSGVVAAVGEGVEKWKVGDEVFGFYLLESSVIVSTVLRLSFRSNPNIYLYRDTTGREWN